MGAKNKELEVRSSVEGFPRRLSPPPQSPRMPHPGAHRGTPGPRRDRGGRSPGAHRSFGGSVRFGGDVKGCAAWPPVGPGRGVRARTAPCACWPFGRGGLVRAHGRSVPRAGRTVPDCVAGYRCPKIVRCQSLRPGGVVEHDVLVRRAAVPCHAMPCHAMPGTRVRRLPISTVASGRHQPLTYCGRAWAAVPSGCRVRGGAETVITALLSRRSRRTGACESRSRGSSPPLSRPRWDARCR